MKLGSFNKDLGLDMQMQSCTRLNWNKYNKMSVCGQIRGYPGMGNGRC